MVRARRREELLQFDAFFKAVFPRAVAVAQRVTGDRAQAEDAAVEALAKANARWERLGETDYADLWVLRVAVNESLRGLSKSRRHPASPVQTVADPADAVALRSALVETLRRLPARQKEVIVLRYLVGLSEPEIADMLRISHGTVKTHLRRAISELRRHMAETQKEEHIARLV